MMLQSTTNRKLDIDLLSAPWTMHEFFAGSGLVAYGLRGMFAPVWANAISEQKAAGNSFSWKKLPFSTVGFELSSKRACT